jgi:hypothetical protein
VLFRNRFVVRALGVVARSINALIMTASRASISINRRGLALTAFNMSTYHTGAKRLFIRKSPPNPSQICARRACIDRPIKRSANGIAAGSPRS